MLGAIHRRKGRGRGMGCGQGQGFGRRWCRGIGSATPAQSFSAPPPQLLSTAAATNQAPASERPLAAKPVTTARRVAFVNPVVCRACGLCANVCPVQAIMVNEAAVIDASRCTGCGRCVGECPEQAIGLREVVDGATACQPGQRRKESSDP